MGNEMINPFSFESYEKLVDDVCWLSNEAILRFNVSLGKKNKDGTKRFFHQEYVYPSKYLDMQNSITIKRSFDSYLTIEMVGALKSIDNVVTIRPRDMIYLQTQLNESVNWFSTVFRRTKSGNISLKGEYKNIKIPLSYEKYIELEPTVIIREDGSKSEGIRLYLNSQDVYTDISIDNYFGFLYSIKDFNMYHNAICLLAYMNPSFGQNATVFDGNSNDYARSDINSANINNNIIHRVNSRQNSSGKSFFDKMNELEEL